MLQKFRSLSGLIFLCLIAVQISAQNMTNVDVNSLSDSQIQQIAKEVETKGMSIDDAAEMAKAKGASQIQIDQLKQRLREIQLTSGNDNIRSSSLSEEESDIMQQAVLSRKAKVKAQDKAKRIFGYQLFNSENLTFEPSVNIPITKDYILGVKDKLIVNVWGASQQVYNVTVDQSGAIHIPGIGPIDLLGLNFEEARAKIKTRLLNIYFGMRGSNPNTWADVSVSGMRSIKVNVMGEALAPGTYTLPATASAFNALYLSGGPNENGSYRNIRIIRDNKIIKVVDVYDYMLNSDTRSNITLRDQDIIYIPTYDIRVDIQGAFKRLGFYELKQNENLTDILRYVGGFRDDAFQSKISVVRMTESQRKINDIEAKQFKSYYPENGDVYSADSLLKRYENRVFISGAVFRPGVYALSKNMQLSELIKKSQGLREDVYNDRGLIIRLTNDLNHETLPFVVSDIQSGKSDILLQREDSIVIQDIFSMRENRFVRIYGEVQKSGQYEYNEKMSITDLVFLAGGFKEAASESYIEISRRHNYQEATKERNEMVKLFRFDIDRKLKINDTLENFILEPYDYVYVRRAPSYFEQKTVSIQGEVLYPGKYSISSKDERISDLIQRAGGLKSHAYPKGATLFRKRIILKQDTVILNNLALNRVSSKRTTEYTSSSSKISRADSIRNQVERHLESGRVELQLEKILASPGSVYDYHLGEGDSLMVPEISEEVNVAGAIYNPIGMAYEPHKNAKYYIDRSGGFWDNANKKRVYVVYSDGTTKVTSGFFLFNNYPSILPGSKIIVPVKPEKPRVEFSMWLAIASTFSSIAIAITAVLR